MKKNDPHYYENANLNSNELPLHTYENGWGEKKKT